MRGAKTENLATAERKRERERGDHMCLLVARIEIVSDLDGATWLPAWEEAR